ncbi:hypothetical protein DIPPA_30244 [Diplonema papillatum]|nr:hypothetical protein DIPPA_30244 [Diplonema papillatum]
MVRMETLKYFKEAGVPRGVARARGIAYETYLDGIKYQEFTDLVLRVAVGKTESADEVKAARRAAQATPFASGRPIAVNRGAAGRSSGFKRKSGHDSGPQAKKGKY